MCLETQDTCPVETQDMCCVESWDMCFGQSQWKGGGLRPPPSVVSIVLALNEAHVQALNTAHVLRADVLALDKAHVLRLNTKICPVFTANTKEVAFGRLHKGGGRPSAEPPHPFVASFVLAVNTGHVLVLRRKTCALSRTKTSALLRRKTWAVLRARTCALLRPNTKVAAITKISKK